MTPSSAKVVPVYLGTATRGRSVGVYRSDFDVGSGALGNLRLAAAASHPSWVTVHPNGRWLYAGTSGPGRPGDVAAFRIGADGLLTALGAESSQGRNPCYLTIDAGGRFLLTANYSSGSVAVLPIRADGSLGAATQAIQFTGSGPDPQRQEGPHAHCIQFDPSGRWVVATDLGTDRVMIYRFAAERGALEPATTPFLKLPPGCGPRHVAFAAGGTRAYVLTELSSELVVCEFDPADGQLTPTQTLPTLPADSPPSTGAEVRVHPSGRWVYASNRGHDSLAIFEVDAGTGRVEFVGHQATGGRTPRGFAFDLTGEFLLVANQDSATIVTFRVNAATGRLAQVGEAFGAPEVVCVAFAAHAA